MDLRFDIDQDELPIFMAETEEQLQVLDEGLIRLEHSGDDEELVQALFRAAHTLKGTSGMIGHKRMVTITHALENALDGVRKHELQVVTSFVDLCLEAVDSLRLLREEVTTKQSSSVEVEDMAGRISAMVVQMGKLQSSAGGTSPQAATTSGGAFEKTAPRSEGAHVEINGIPVYDIKIKISENSIASAARAFQVVLALDRKSVV